MAYIYEFGDYLAIVDTTGGDSGTATGVTVRNTLTTNRFFASIIYRFGGRWQP